MAEPGSGTFADAGPPVVDRVAALLAALTTAEKVGLLHQRQAPVPRLGIGEFRTGTEALHGLAWLGPATVFPQAVGLASTWNRDLLRQVGAAVGDETRGFHHKDPTRAGLNVWAPVVNPLRDPRWGRNEEGYAEDPYLTGDLADAYASGLRGDHPTYLRTAPTLKHFLAYNNETGRGETSSNMPPRVLYEYELPAFQRSIATGSAVAVMGSYNLVNGRPAHLSPLINNTLRRWAPGEVLVVSDLDAASNVVASQAYYSDHVESFAALLRAGVDSFTDGPDASQTVERITEALRRGLLDEADVDDAVRRILTIRFRLGEFDPPEDNPYAGITEEVINCPAHQALALQAARQAIVLLKNDPAGPGTGAGLLPLDPAGLRRVAVIGPSADRLYEDWYSGTLPYAVTVRRGLTERLGTRSTVDFAEGVDRVVLRVPGGGALAASDAPDGAALTVDALPPDGTASGFDLFDWGNGVWAVRSVANGRYITVDDTGRLVNAAIQPNGWVVRETFAIERRGADAVVRHVATGAYVTVGADGGVRADAADAEQATVLRIEPVRSGIAEAVAAATDADVAVVVVGNHPMINGRETEDRVDLRLPPAQEALIRAVRAANPRTVLLVTSSYPYGIGWADEHVPAILWSAHGGQEYGHAVAEVLVGDTAPAGRLTQTWYHSAAELPDLLEYDVIAADATYLYFRGTPLYPFGHGLTYPSIEYSALRLSTDHLGVDGYVEVSVDVRNHGDRDTDEVVQLYTRQHRSRVKQPQRALRDFARVRVPAGGRTTVRFELAAAALAFWDVTQDRYVVEEATHDLLVGRSSTDIRLTAPLRVHGERIPLRDLSQPLHIANADEYADVEFIDADKRTGDAARACVGGAWLSFTGVDVTGVARCEARVSHTGAEDVTVRIRLDDPIDGPLLATLTAAGCGDRYAWAAVTATPTVPGAGVHDLYTVLEPAGACLRDVRFEPSVVLQPRPLLQDVQQQE